MWHFRTKDQISKPNVSGAVISCNSRMTWVFFFKWQQSEALAAEIQKQLELFWIIKLNSWGWRFLGIIKVKGVYNDTIMQMVEQTNIWEDHIEACRLVYLNKQSKKRYKLQHIVCKHLSFKEWKKSICIHFNWWARYYDKHLQILMFIRIPDLQQKKKTIMSQIIAKQQKIK